VAATDCAEIVEGVLRTMADVLRQADAQVDVALCDVPVMADREGLAIVLRNLLENALKFSRAGTAPRIRIESTFEGETYLLKVHDNGIGFEPEYREKIFDIFQRLHASGYEGTGIGLALVRKAVQRMHGRVWAESVPGAGSTFFVRLEPAASAASAGSETR
jgi:signal transduction histidine kinase